MTQTLVSTIVDARGLSCPMPIVKAALWLRSVTSGQLMELLATDPGSVKDVVAWCRTTGNDLLEQRTDDTGVYHFVIRRA